jgi:hypothetical protein
MCKTQVLVRRAPRHHALAFFLRLCFYNTALYRPSSCQGLDPRALIRRVATRSKHFCKDHAGIRRVKTLQYSMGGAI